MKKWRSGWLYPQVRPGFQPVLFTLAWVKLFKCILRFKILNVSCTILRGTEVDGFPPVIESSGRWSDRVMRGGGLLASTCRAASLSVEESVWDARLGFSGTQGYWHYNVQSKITKEFVFFWLLSQRRRNEHSFCYVCLVSPGLPFTVLRKRIKSCFWVCVKEFFRSKLFLEELEQLWAGGVVCSACSKAKAGKNAHFQSDSRS